MIRDLNLWEVRLASSRNSDKAVVEGRFHRIRDEVLNDLGLSKIMGDDGNGPCLSCRSVMIRSSRLVDCSMLFTSRRIAGFVPTSMSVAPSVTDAASTSTKVANARREF